MHRNKKIEVLNKQKAQKEEGLKNIMKRIIPHDMREYFTENPFKPCELENILLLSVRYINFSIDTEENIQETLQKMTEYNTAIINASSECDDCRVAKKHNTMTFVLFNVKSQSNQVKCKFPDVIKFAKSVSKQCHEKGIDVGFALTLSKDLIMGSLSHFRSAFNMFSPDITRNYSLSLIAGKDELLIHKLQNEMPKDVLDKIVMIHHSTLDSVSKVLINEL